MKPFSLQRRQLWVEEVVPNDNDFDSATAFLGVGIDAKRLWWFGSAACVAIAVLFVRVAELQLVRGNEMRMQAEHNRLRIHSITPERGIISDRNGIPLVSNEPNFRLVIRSQDLPRGAKERAEAIKNIGAQVGLSAQKTSELIRNFNELNYSSAVLKDPIEYRDALLMYSVAPFAPSIAIERGARRRYEAGVPGQTFAIPESLSHVVGYIGRIAPDELMNASSDYTPTDVIGKMGIESGFENELRGIPGTEDVEADAFGAERRTVAVKEPVPGAEILLTIDIRIQNALEDALKKGLAMAGQRKGSAIAIDPRDGSVLGLVSLPSYDPNVFSGGISAQEFEKLLKDENQPLLNRAVSGQFPSGSTIKPFIAAAALQEKIVTTTSSILSVGGIQIGKWFFPDWKQGGHGLTDVYKAIAWSVNTYFYTVGGGYGSVQGLGPERIKKYLEYFGFGRRSGIAMPGEANGFLPSPKWKTEKKGEQWYIGDTYNISIGQGDILVSPVQMALAVGAVANGGILWKPRVVNFVRSKDSEKIILPEISAKVPVDKEWLAAVRAGMRHTVTDGSARSLSSVPVAIAGKTGTAQWSSTRPPHAWFTSFAPYENPEIVVVFMIEEGREGSAVAVPAAKQFYEWWGKYRIGRGV